MRVAASCLGSGALEAVMKFGPAAGKVAGVQLAPTDARSPTAPPAPPLDRIPVWLYAILT